MAILVNQLRMISRAIQLHGKKAELLRCKENTFRSIGEPERIGCMRGLYHTSHSYLQLPAQDSGKIPQRNQPMFLILFSDKLKLEDQLIIDTGRYKIVGIEDPGGLHVCLDLSLERV